MVVEIINQWLMKKRIILHCILDRRTLP